MQFPRFGTKSLLVAFAIAALWLSTFTGYSAGQDVRRSILLLILVAFGFLAVYSRGQQRAFCSAFFAVMLACGGLNLQQPLYRYTPEFAWQNSLGVSNAFPPPPTYIPTAAVPAYTTSTWSAPASPQGVYPVTPYILQPAPMAPSAMRIALGETITAAWTLALSAIAGFVAAYILAQMPRSEREPR